MLIRSRPAARRRISCPALATSLRTPPGPLKAAYDALVVRKADLSLIAEGLRVTRSRVKAVADLPPDLRAIFSPPDGDWKKALALEVDRIDGEMNDLAQRIDTAMLDGAA